MIGGIPALLLSCSKKKSHPEGGLFGAGYGSRTRLHGLGSRCITDIRILRLAAIIAERNGKFNRFLSLVLYRFESTCIMPVTMIV